MPNLPRARLSVFPTRSHVEDWSSIHIEACEDNLTSLGLNTNIIGRYQFWLIRPPPFQGPFDPVFTVMKLPFGGAHVSGVGSRIGEETLFPRIVLVRLWKGDGFGVLFELRDEAELMIIILPPFLHARFLWGHGEDITGLWAQ